MPNQLQFLPIHEAWVFFINYDHDTIGEIVSGIQGNVAALVPAGLSQESVINGVEADILSGFDIDFPTNSDEVLRPTNQSALYNSIVPAAIEVVNIGEGHMSAERHAYILAFLRQQANEMVSEQLLAKRCALTAEGSEAIQLQGRLISSNPPCSKKRVTHGQKGQRRKRHQCETIMHVY
jgi:hypothetical protein